MANTASTESHRHESSGLELRPLITFAICFVIGLAVVHLLVWLVFVGFRSAVGQERQVTGVTEARIPPPPPQLQPSIDHSRLPAQDLASLRAAEEAELKRRGLIDEKGNPRFSDELVRKVAAQAK